MEALRRERSARNAGANRRPRLGFLGVGWIGRHRLAALARTGLAELVAVADPAREAREEAQRLAPGARGFASLEELFDLDLDGIVVATPSAAHAQQATRALERGLAVFCQKPLARDAAEAGAVVAAARRADRLLAIDLCYRSLAGVPELRRRLRARELGEVFAAELCFHNAYGPDKPWFRDVRLSGGGCVIDLGIHLIDLLLWLLDFPHVRAVSSRIYRRGKPLNGREDVEDFAEARLDLAGGPSARLACSWSLPLGRDAAIEARLFGSEGAGVLENVGGSFYDFRVSHVRGRRCEVLAEPPDDWGGRPIVEWTRRLARGEAGFDPGCERHLDVMRVVDAIYGAGDCGFS